MYGSIKERLISTTVRIVTDKGIGTGFLMYFCQLKKFNVPCIVTNKHVIENATKGEILFSCNNKNTITISVGDFSSKWLNHPESDVDLCVLPIAEMLWELKEKKIELEHSYLDVKLIYTKEQLIMIDAIEDIVMIGYPNGLWDSTNNKPIVRRGITATHPKYDFENRKEFLIDAACFPGSSGSPVFIVNIDTYCDKFGNVHKCDTPRVIFLGVLYAGPEQEVNIQMYSTTNHHVSMPINLGYVIKAEKLLDFESLIKKRIKISEYELE